MKGLYKMRYVKWGFWVVAAVLILGVLHYSLPQHDVVRITDTYEKRIDFGRNAMFFADGPRDAAGALQNRDVFFIQTTRADGSVMVFRNEDTGWGWPFYFKFDTANLQAEASNFKSTAEAPKWVAVRHYGWRNQLMSIYPNATAIMPVAGPDDAPLPWRPVLILLLLAAVLRAVYVRAARLWRGQIIPRFGKLRKTA